jgi:phosphoglycolate phosphatase
MLNRVPLQAVLFDWDGTLLNSYQSDARTYAAMFAELKIPWNPAALERHYSPDWHDLYRAAAIPRNQWERADRVWRKFYRRERPSLQPGARRILQRLARRYRLGLVTGGSAWRVRAQLRATTLTPLFEIRVFADDAPRRKPHPAPLQLALRRIACPPEACVYVGDTPEDVIMARRARVPVVGIIGHSPVAERLRASRPDALIDTLDNLSELLLKR